MPAPSIVNDFPVGEVNGIVNDFPVGEVNGQQPTVHVRDITNDWDLFDRGADELSHYPASCAKLMTLLIARDMHAADWFSGIVTVAAADVVQPIPGLTLSMSGLQGGDVVCWNDLAHALMLPSGCDAAMAIARQIGYELAGDGDDDLDAASCVRRFVALMNVEAAGMDLEGAVFVDPFGGSEWNGTVRTVLSARHLSTLIEHLGTDEVAVSIGSATSHTAVITGPNARSLLLSSNVPFNNGPTFAPDGDKDESVGIAKTGIWQIGGIKQYNMALIWTTPGGVEVAISVIGSVTIWASMLDVRGIMNALLINFPYLADGWEPGSDGFAAETKLLVGFEAPAVVVDQSAADRPLTTVNVEVEPGLILNSMGSMSFAGSGVLTAADSPDFRIGSGNFTMEMWFAGDGAPPAAGVEFLFAAKLGGDQREWAFNWYGGGFNIFASASGQSWSYSYVPDTADANVMFNGAPRHLAYVKDGANWHLYVDGERLLQVVTLATPFDGTGSVTIGTGVKGEIEEVRMTVGVARYIDGMEPIVAIAFPRS